MGKQTAWLVVIIILLAAFFLYQFKLLDFPFYGDEVDSGDVTAKILQGQIAPFFPDGDGHEALYNYTMAPFFAIMGESVIASRWPSVAWGMVTVALMYVYGQRLFKSRRVGVMAAALTAGMVWPALFAHLSLRVVTLLGMMIPALLGLGAIVQASSQRRALKAGIVGGLFAGLAAYTYTSGRGFPAIVILFLAYLAVVQRDILFKRWQAFVIYGIGMGVMSIWLYAYLRVHPEFDNRIREMAQMSWFFRGDWSGLIPAILQTLGMFTLRGEPNWVNNIADRPAFVGPEGWLFYIGLLLCIIRWRKPVYGLQLIVLVTHMSLSVITIHPPSWPRSMGMLPPLIMITVLPVEWMWKKLEEIRERGSNNQWLNRLRARAVLPTYVVLIALLGISVYTRTAYDILEVWMNAPGVYWMSLAYYDETAKYINRSPDSTPLNFSMDWFVPWRKTNLKRAVQRQDVTLRWSINNAFVFPQDSRGWRIAFQSLAAPARPLLDTFLNLDAPLYVDSRVDPEGQRVLRVYGVSRAQLDEHLARAREGALFLPGTTTRIPMPIQANDTLEFLGYEILNPDARAGGDLNALTYWRVLQRPPASAVFLHLLDANQKIIAQYDGLDVVVDDLMSGDTIAQLHTLKLPADLQPATFHIEFGVYLRDNLERLPFNTGTDALWLQTWTLR